MIKRIFLYTFFGLMAVLNVTAQTTQQPALVVGIMVDGLQQKHLDVFTSEYGNFKSFINSSAAALLAYSSIFP